MRAFTKSWRKTKRAWSVNSLLRPVPEADYGLDITARIHSAREVCGDLYDFLTYGSQQLGIALGDVSGKGSAAALYGAVATGILRSLSPHKLQPAELLRHLAERPPHASRRQRRPDAAAALEGRPR